MAMNSRKLKKILVRDLNGELTCPLCLGYFVDATTLVDCLHVFCRGCLLKHFESSKHSCPTCNKKKTSFRPDPQIQALVYKMIPGLYSKEMQRREDFYRSTGVRANSSCSDDSVLGDLRLDKEKWMSINMDYTTQFFSPEDSISLSLEYYQYHLDNTSTDSSTKKLSSPETSAISEQSAVAKVDAESKCSAATSDKNNSDDRVRDRRYLQCPAAVSMSHLQKFLRMKYALSPEHKVDIIYEGEVLPPQFNLMDVAYTFNWTKVKPMRFFYRIFTPMKIQPIKIINTSSSSGSKQLQIVPVKPNSDQKSQAEQDAANGESESQNIRNKERLMAHLKLQSRHKLPEDDGDEKKKVVDTHCVYEYQEPDKEEIKRFAEKRDREWARMGSEDQEVHHVKKRKKNKHSKSDMTHKKRKIHAEITSDVKQESIKLKVKLTPHNGHKHKHHRSTPQISDLEKESVNKEKLQELRAVRHKEEKPVQAEVPKEDILNEQKTFLKTFQSGTDRINKNSEKVEADKVEKVEPVQKKPVNTYSNQNSNKSLERQIATLQQQCTIEAKPSVNKVEKDKKVSFSNEKPHILNSQYSNSGFTVSKVDSGAKRKVEEEDKEKDKRPSLEITLINPQPTEAKPKRPPPATIPLKRIKNSVNLKSGVSIIPKTPDKCDNIGALDLSKPHKLDSNGMTTLNGIKSLNNFTKLSDKNSQLSNLQMLSKVASEQQISKPANNVNNNNKVRPQMPSLQTIKVPTPQNNSKLPNLSKMPNLTEINKSKFKLLNPAQVRNMRPSQNQNQSIRSIPNPSLIVRQQNQNRLNLNTPNTPTTLQNGDVKEPKILNTLAKDKTTGKDESKTPENGK